jgi:acetyl-CoA C-acetyltransferase
MTRGIRDKVVIIGMGCTRFGERWEVGAEELMVEAFNECINDAAIETKDIQAAWLSTCLTEVNVGKSALPLSKTLRLPFIPVTRVENYCASGTEAFRGAVYGVASGAYDTCLAMGVEKLKDTGYGGLPNQGSNAGTLDWLWLPNYTAPGLFAQLASAYAAKHKIADQDLKRAMAHVSVKSHANAVNNPKAHLRKAISESQVINAPMVAHPLGLYDCCGVSDGAACAIVTTVENAKKLGKKNLISVKALQLALSSGEEIGFDSWDGDHFMTTDICAKRAYQEAGINDPHDCFSITELVTYEDLHISKRGQAWQDILDGRFDIDGQIPTQVDGGLKCFGHPIGASGLRMIYEMYLQLSGQANERQLDNPGYGLTHNLGGFPAMNVCAISIIGKYLS